MAGRERSEQSFVHLTTQTILGTPDEYAKTAIAGGMEKIGLANESIDLWHVFQKSCREQGCKPIFGATVVDRTGDYHNPVSLIVESPQGFHSLFALFNKPSVSIATIYDHQEGLVAIAPRKSYLTARMMVDPDRIFLKLTHFADEQSARELAEDISFADTNNAQTVASNDVWRSTPRRNDQFLHLALKARKEGKTLFQKDWSTIDTSVNSDVYRHAEKIGIQTNHPQAWIKSPYLMRLLLPRSHAYYAQWQSACDATVDIANNIHASELPKQTVPRYVTPVGVSASDVLRERVYERITDRYAGAVPREVVERLEYELTAIGEYDRADDFLYIDDFLRHAKDLGIAHSGEGAANDCMVNYALDITQVDPLAYGLPFERFMSRLQGEGRSDFDIAVDSERRKELLDYLFSQDPSHRGAHIVRIAAFERYGAREGMTALLKAFGATDEYISKIKDSVFQSPETVNLEDVTPFESTLVHAADELEKRQVYTDDMSTHASKLLVWEKSPDQTHRVIYDRTHGHPMVAENKDTVEDHIRVDFLSRAYVALLDRVCKRVNRDPRSIPIDDQETLYEIFHGNTIDLPLIEPPHTRGIIYAVGQALRWQDLNFYHLVLSYGLSRPGIDDNFREQFYEQLRKKHPYRYNSETVDAILERTYGIILFQEQFPPLATGVAGFSEEQADALRKSLSKMPEDQIEQITRQFYFGARGRGLPKEQAARLSSQIVSARHYMFNEGHAIAHMQKASQLGFLKNHYREDFMDVVNKLKI